MRCNKGKIVENKTVKYTHKTRDIKQQEIQLPITIDCDVLRAAQRIYRSYCVLYPKNDRQPCGIAINRKNKQGQIIFRKKPILLPGESFISTNQLEIEVH